MGRDRDKREGQGRKAWQKKERRDRVGREGREHGGQEGGGEGKGDEMGISPPSSFLKVGAYMQHGRASHEVHVARHYNVVDRSPSRSRSGLSITLDHPQHYSAAPSS